MGNLGINDWLDIKPNSDDESNYYQLLAILKNVEKLALIDRNAAISELKNMIVDLECAHLKLIRSHDVLNKIITGKYVISYYHHMLINNKHKNGIGKIANGKYWKHVKIESPTVI